MAKLSEFHAAMGLAMLDEIENILDTRKAIYSCYSKELNGHFSLQYIPEEVDYNYAYFPMLFKSSSALLDCKKFLEKQQIFPRRYFYPSLERYNTLGVISCTNADDVANRILCLPIYLDLNLKQVKDICNIVKKFAH